MYLILHNILVVQTMWSLLPPDNEEYSECVCVIIVGKEKALGLLLHLLEGLGPCAWEGNTQGLALALDKLAFQFRETQVNVWNKHDTLCLIRCFIPLLNWNTVYTHYIIKSILHAMDKDQLFWIFFTCNMQLKEFWKKSQVMFNTYLFGCLFAMVCILGGWQVWDLQYHQQNADSHR